eukprot:17606-Heterococcus_DN1.PRE.4
MAIVVHQGDGFELLARAHISWFRSPHSTDQHDQLCNTATLPEAPTPAIKRLHHPFLSAVDKGGVKVSSNASGAFKPAARRAL